MSQRPRRTHAARAKNTASESEATEDNDILLDVGEQNTPYKRRCLVKQRNTVASEKLKNGRYGIFSQATTPRSSMAASSARRTRASTRKVSIRRRDIGGNVGEIQNPEDSSLSEPENGQEGVRDISGVESTMMRSPSAGATTQERAKTVKRELPTSSHHEAPIMLSNAGSDREIVEELSAAAPIVASKKDFPDFAQVFGDSPLLGNIDVLPDYIDTIATLSDQLTIKQAHMDTIASYDAEDKALEKKITDLSEEQQKHNAAIAQAYAEKIAQDMSSQTFQDNETIQQLLQMRQAEAENGRAEVARLMPMRKTEYETQRDAIPARKAAVESQLREVEVKIEDLKKQKLGLEEVGGLAMAFALGRMAEAAWGEEDRRVT